MKTYYDQRAPEYDDWYEGMHFYGHLERADRGRFLSEARRVAPELIVVDAALRDDVQAEEWERWRAALPLGA